MAQEKKLSAYYQAHIKRDKVWFVVGVLRNEDHIVFERTIDKKESLFEFFVPDLHHDLFVKIMRSFEQKGYVSNFRSLPNRFASEEV